MISSFLALVGVSAFAITTPGPGTAVAVRNMLLGGCMAGILTALGGGDGRLAVDASAYPSPRS